MGEHEISVGNHDAKRSGFQLIEKELPTFSLGMEFLTPQIERKEKEKKEQARPMSSRFANHRLENVLKQFVHTSAVPSSRYEARGKFGEHSRGQSIFRALQTSHVLHISMNAQLTYEPIVL